jgi:hypothetical protein
MRAYVLPTAGCSDIDPSTPCIYARLSTPTEEGYARIMLRGSTTLATAVELRTAEVRLSRTFHRRTSGTEKLHSSVASLGQQGTEA